MSKLVGRSHEFQFPVYVQELVNSRGTDANEGMLSLSPMQFRAQDFEELLPVFFAEQLYTTSTQLAFNAIAALDRDAYLPIRGQEAFFLSYLHIHDNFRSLLHNQRTMRQSMRGDRRHHQSLNTWCQNGTAGGERIRRRAGGRSND